MMLNAASMVPLVVAVSFAAGLNLYLTVFVLGLMARLQWAVLPGSLGILSSPYVMAAAAVLLAADFVADKIPGFDLVWNAAHTFIRVPLAALMAFAAAQHLPPMQQALAASLGAAIAAVAHGSKLAARVVVTPSPEPVSNVLLSFGGDVAAVALSWLAVHRSMVGMVLALVFVAAGGAACCLAARTASGIWSRIRDWRCSTFKPALAGAMRSRLSLKS